MTPPTITNVWIAITAARPAASSLLNPSSAATDARSPLATSSTNSSSSAVVPSRPSSSPIAEKMKSFQDDGISCGWPRPRPEPDTPPVARANHDWASW